LTPRFTTRSGTCFDAVEHLLHGESDIVHLHEHLVVEGIEAYRHPAKTGRGEGVGLPIEQNTVGGQSDVGQAVDRPEHCDQLLEVLAEQRFSAGDPDLLDAGAYRDRRQPGQFLERQEQIPGKELVLTAEDLLRHAIPAAEVAPIGDRDTQIFERPIPGVLQHEDRR
jgi:hypothetical protein